MIKRIVIGCAIAAAMSCSQPAQRRSVDVDDAEIPCAPRAVLAAVCWNCHTDPPKNGAPFSQRTYRDIDAELDGEKVWSRMRRAIEEGRMPLDPYTLSDEQERTLLTWLRADAPPAPAGTVCSQ